MFYRLSKEYGKQVCVVLYSVFGWLAARKKPLPLVSLLLMHLTDGTDTGTVFRDGRRIQIERWGRLPHLLRAGRAEVSLAVREGDWRVYALNAAGRRCGEVPAIRKDGRLAFWADVSLRPNDATFLYELTTGGDRRPQP